MSSPPTYAPLSLHTINEPHQVYDEMLASVPIHWHEQMQCWVVVRYDDCREVLSNHVVYARDWRRVGDEISPLKESIQSIDPPQQTVLRTIFLNALKAQPVESICRDASDAIRQRLNERTDMGSFEFLRELSAPYALQVISALLDVPAPDASSFLTLSEDIARGMDAGLDPSVIAPAEEARRGLYNLVDCWLAQPTRSGLIASLLTETTAAGVQHHVLRNTLGILFNAGFSTTYATTGNATLTLLRHPDALSVLRDPSRVPAAVEELLRFDGPAQGTSRVATCDTEIAGTRIKRGDVVLALLAAANRDPRQFDRPGELILNRSPNRHFGFG